MKRLLILSVLLCGTLLAAAQTTKEDFLRRYNNLVDRVGPTGVGVETLLDNWAAAGGRPADAGPFCLLLCAQPEQPGD